MLHENRIILCLEKSFCGIGKEPRAWDRRVGQSDKRAVVRLRRGAQDWESIKDDRHMERGHPKGRTHFLTLEWGGPTLPPSPTN